MASSRQSVVNVTRRMAAERLDVAPQRRHLERNLVGDDRHRAVLDAGRNRVQPGARGEAHDFLGRRRRGDVDVLHRGAHERVAHRAADGARLAAFGASSAVEYRARRRRVAATRRPQGCGGPALSSARGIVLPAANR